MAEVTAIEHKSDNDAVRVVTRTVFAIPRIVAGLLMLFSAAAWAAEPGRYATKPANAKPTYQYIATAKALRALALCGEIPEMPVDLQRSNQRSIAK